MQFPLGLRRIIISWRDKRQAYVAFGNKKSKTFNIHIVSIFTAFHADLVKCIGAFSTHLFADGLSTLVVSPVTKNLKEMLHFLNEKFAQISQAIFDYAVKWITAP